MVRRRRQATGKTQLRIGIFGLFGSGNIGNDGCLEMMLEHLRSDVPDAVVDAMCPGSAVIKDRYGIDATELHWRPTEGMAKVLRGLGKLADAPWTFRWVRRHDVVMVPGTGVLESSLRLRPWQTPYALFLATGFARLLNKKVALVSVGADVSGERLTRFLFRGSVRLASYRSFRDDYSAEAMRRQGVKKDLPVFPDLVFASPAPATEQVDARSVGVGVMAYYGADDFGSSAEAIHAEYVKKMTDFVRWLLDTGHSVRLLVGDSVHDCEVVRSVLGGLRSHDAFNRVVAEPIISMDDLLSQISRVATVVASRYHNVLCALKLGKPTISLGYSPKHDALMREMGVGNFCQSAGEIDLKQLTEQFALLEERLPELRSILRRRSTQQSDASEEQFRLLEAELDTWARHPA
jgi:polysaccharide pyruvyl transferase WcaK-like protein